ncbi:hypothetical protein MWU49_15720 [Alcanivorax sp. S6407]|nr:hypothetical protein [Alcanivorax sp. S6407]MCK0155163.1 hypothetical protein [Alcanivorax sp. S6407]
MTTTIKEFMHALATLLGGSRFNDYLEAKQPVPIPIKVAPPQHPDHYR